jgi:GNAT superfamily N-acetyltransferase
MEYMTPTLLNGSPIDVRPIRRHELGKVLLRCLPDGGGIETLFKTQETIGMAAWDGDQCVAQLHCYRLVLPHGPIDHWPAWNRPFYLEAVLDGCLGITGPVWCHACCHVGRSIDSFSHSDQPDRRYFGRGIGTALCQASINWAREHDYQAVLASGTPEDLFEFAVWAGGLPWTTYQKLGFVDAALDLGDDLPEWATGNSPPEVMESVRAALAAGRPWREFHSRLMVLRLKDG